MRSHDRGLCNSKVLGDQTEAHAEAARDYIMIELVTKQDLLATKQELQTAMENLCLRLTVRLGGLLALGIEALAALIKPT
jgi:hypothetical protein